MTCANCVHHVREALMGVGGVIEARVDLRKGEAWVDTEPERVDVAALIESVKRAGYDARPAGE